MTGLTLATGTPVFRQRRRPSVNIDTVTPNSTEIRGAGATAQNLAVGQNGTGMLIIQNGGTLTDSFGTLAIYRAGWAR